MRGGEQQVKPVSAWLFNCIQTKHANAMDNMPSPTILPREEGDRWEAEKLSSILPVIFDQNDFEQIYSERGITNAAPVPQFTVFFGTGASTAVSEILR